MGPPPAGAKALRGNGISKGRRGPGGAAGVPPLMGVVVGTLVGTVAINPEGSLWSRAAARPDVFHLFCVLNLKSFKKTYFSGSRGYLIDP